MSQHVGVSASEQLPLEGARQGRRYCLQGWHCGAEFVSETFHRNQAFARYLNEHLPPSFSDRLRILPARPLHQGQALVTPRTVYASIRQPMSQEDEEDIITAFRDECFLSLTRSYFHTDLRQTLDFWNCLVRSANGSVLRNPIAKVMVLRSFKRRLSGGLSLPKEESWLDASSGIALDLVSAPVAQLYFAGTYIASCFGRSSSETGGSHGPAPPPPYTAGPQQGASASEPEPEPAPAPEPGPDTARSMERLAHALRDILEWCASRHQATEANATAGTAESYTQFKDACRTYIGLLRALCEAYEASLSQSEGTQAQVLDVSRICTDLVHSDAVRTHGQMLIANLNRTRLLDDVVSRHSFKKSVCYGGGALGGVGLFVGGCLTLSGGLLAVAAGLGALIAIGGTGKTLEHNEYRNRVKQVKVDYESFERAWNTVARTLALQLAASMGFDLTIEDEHLRNHFLTSLGLDLHDFNEADYLMAGLSLHVENLHNTFQKLTNNIDWLDEKERMGLATGAQIEA